MSDLIMSALALQSTNRVRNDNIIVFVLIGAGLIAALFCMWKGGSLVWSFMGSNGWVYVACKF